MSDFDESFRRYLSQIDEPEESSGRFLHPEHGLVCRRCWWLAQRVSATEPCPVCEGGPDED